MKGINGIIVPMVTTLTMEHELDCYGLENHRRGTVLEHGATDGGQSGSLPFLFGTYPCVDWI